MEFTDKQIKRILYIQEFVAAANVLSKIYVDFENKEYFIDTFNDRGIVYKLFCASIYNLVKAILDSKEYFINAKKYVEFNEILNQEYIANDDKYYDMENYRATLFRIIETIRHQVNHSLKDDEDNNVLFEAYIDFSILDDLRKIINEIFSEVYNMIDKKRIKFIVLDKPKVRYSLDRVSNKLEELKLKIPENDNKLNGILKSDCNRLYESFEQLFNGSNLYDLYNMDPKAIEKFEIADKEINESLINVENYVRENGTELEKKTLSIFKEFMIDRDEMSIKNINDNIKELQERLVRLHEENNANENSDA